MLTEQGGCCNRFVEETFPGEQSTVYASWWILFGPGYKFETTAGIMKLAYFYSTANPGVSYLNCNGVTATGCALKFFTDQGASLLCKDYNQWTPLDNNWHHLEVLLDSAGNDVTVWLDGAVTSCNNSPALQGAPYWEIKLGQYYNGAVPANDYLYLDDVVLGAGRP